MYDDIFKKKKPKKKKNLKISTTFYQAYFTQMSSDTTQEYFWHRWLSRMAGSILAGRLTLKYFLRTSSAVLSLPLIEGR